MPTIGCTEAAARFCVEATFVCDPVFCLNQFPARWVASTMPEEKAATDRVTFGRGHDVCIMAIDGTWRRGCQLQAISDTEASLTVEGSIQGLNLKEFFLLLSSTGLAYRRCELVRVNGAEMDIQFVKGKNKKKRSNASSGQEATIA